MNAKRPVNNLKNQAYTAVKQTVGKASAKSVKKSSRPQAKSKAPSPPPHTGVIAKRAF